MLSQCLAHHVGPVFGRRGSKLSPVARRRAIHGWRSRAPIRGPAVKVLVPPRSIRPGRSGLCLPGALHLPANQRVNHGVSLGSSAPLPSNSSCLLPFHPPAPNWRINRTAALRRPDNWCCASWLRSWLLPATGRQTVTACVPDSRLVFAAGHCHYRRSAVPFHIPYRSIIHYGNRCASSSSSAMAGLGSAQ